MLRSYSASFCAASLIAVAWTAGALAAPAVAPRTFDLATARVDGHRLLGRSVPGVTAALGRPGERVRGDRRYVLRYDSLGSGRWGVTILFRRDRDRLSAWSIALADPRLTEVKLGYLLRRRPAAALRAVTATYSGLYSVARPYRCRTKPRICSGELAARGPSGIHLAFGALPPAAGGTFVTIFERS
jgi:hypothetical protein